MPSATDSAATSDHHFAALGKFDCVVGEGDDDLPEPHRISDQVVRHVRWNVGDELKMLLMARIPRGLRVPPMRSRRLKGMASSLAAPIAAIRIAQQRITRSFEEAGRTPPCREDDSQRQVAARRNATAVTGFFLRVDLPVDRLLFDASLGAGSATPNQMAPNTAFNFLLVGCAFLFLEIRNGRVIAWACIFALICGFEALLAVLGYAYGSSRSTVWDIHSDGTSHRRLFSPGRLGIYNLRLRPERRNFFYALRRRSLFRMRSCSC